MTRFAISLPTAVLAATVLVGAQATSQQPPPDRPTTTTPQPSAQPSEPRATSPAEAKAKQTTMSGCLKPGTSADTYLLTNAGMSSAAGSAAPTAQGTTGSTKSYAVTVKPGTDISKHVNHKIEVTGTVSPSTSASTSTAPASGTPSAGTAQPTETFNVESFKMVAMACP